MVAPLAANAHQVHRRRRVGSRSARHVRLANTKCHMGSCSALGAHLVALVMHSRVDRATQRFAETARTASIRRVKVCLNVPFVCLAVLANMVNTELCMAHIVNFVLLASTKTLVQRHIASHVVG